MPSADVIITNARVFTSDESNPHAEAVADLVLFSHDLFEERPKKSQLPKP